MVNRWGTITVTSALVFASLPVHAQTCTPLKVVKGSGTQVQKKVSPPSTGVTKSNWNTDFAVPSNQKFSKYVARIVPKNSGEYSIQMNLKYSNGTADKAQDQTVKLQQGKTFTVTGAPRTNATPYQINVSVGGVEALGNSYTLSVSGCR